MTDNEDRARIIIEDLNVATAALQKAQEDHVLAAEALYGLITIEDIFRHGRPADIRSFIDRQEVGTLRALAIAVTRTVFPDLWNLPGPPAFPSEVVVAIRLAMRLQEGEDSLSEERIERLRAEIMTLESALRSIQTVSHIVDAEGSLRAEIQKRATELAQINVVKGLKVPPF